MSVFESGLPPAGGEASPPNSEVMRRMKVDLPQPESAASAMTTVSPSAHVVAWRPAAARAARAAADAARERALDAGDAAAARRAMALGASVQDTGADLGAGEDTSTLLLELALALLEDLRSLPTSADEDDAMLASAPLAPPLRAAVAYRAERKRLGRQLADVLMAAADLVDAK
mmetsp:Transcript_8234/g.33327  ORF Transcript_8234/g.33327 Transcript_8234/m.33327 type:complete len:173 (-) Transcript_8234:2-520(-)